MTRIAMSFPLSARKGLFVAALLLGLQLPAVAESAFTRQGGEYDVTGAVPGDQSNPSLSINADGGYLVWEDNNSSSGGGRIGGRRLNENLSGVFDVFQVNQTLTGVHERPQVAMLANGGAVFVWQAGQNGFRNVYARFMAPNGGFITSEIKVNTYAVGDKEKPSVTCLKDGSVVIVWESAAQDDSANGDQSLRELLGVYGQKFSSAGDRLGSEFRVNQTVIRNQRNPSVAALPNGGFAVTWVSERLRGQVINTSETGSNTEGQAGVIQEYTADVYARVFDAETQPVSSEFVVNRSAIKVSSPKVTVSASGSLLVAWSQYLGRFESGGVLYTNGWDILTRSYSSLGIALSEPLQVNETGYGDQLYPEVATIGENHMVVWTSLNQDGSRKGVYGRFLTTTGNFLGGEALVNSTVIGQQKTPTVASDNESRFLVSWMSYAVGKGGYDLFAQRYTGGELLPAPAAPFASPLSQTKISLSWPDFAGFDVAAYLVYVGEDSNPLTLTTNVHTFTGLSAATTYSYRLAYKLTDGRVSPASDSVTVATWGYDENFDGLPDDWQQAYWGEAAWPVGNVDSDGDGATNIQEFFAGTNPMDSSSALRTHIVVGPFGPVMEWNTVPGSLYRVQVSTNFTTWVDVGGIRFSPNATDSVPVNAEGTMVFFRVIRIR